MDFGIWYWYWEKFYIHMFLMHFIWMNGVVSEWIGFLRVLVMSMMR